MIKDNHSSQATTAKIIHFPADVVSQAQAVCAQQGQSFTQFVLQAVRSAINDLHNDEKE